jgi:hypothetical protein
LTFPQEAVYFRLDKKTLPLDSIGRESDSGHRTVSGDLEQPRFKYDYPGGELALPAVKAGVTIRSETK